MARTKKSSVKPVEKREVSRKVINGAFIIFFDDGSIQIIAKPIDLTKEEVSSLFGSSEEEEEEEDVPVKTKKAKKKKRKGPGCLVAVIAVFLVLVAAASFGIS